MASHMSNIGLRATTSEEFRRYARQTVELGETIEVKNGTYIHWKVGRGAELWAQVDHKHNLVGLNPHFQGDARMQVGLVRHIKRTGDSALEGAFYAWADPRSNDPETGEFPFVFDSPDYDVHSSLQLPTIVQVQIAAFAHELEGFENDEAYYASQGDEPKFAAEAFIPSGLFSAAGSVNEPPKSLAIFVGHVLVTETITNAMTKREFYWAKVRTLGGEVDVVADPEIVRGKVIKAGVVKGKFWLSGIIRRHH